MATTGQHRSIAFPNLPTLDELGIKGVEASAWWGLFSPAKVPADVVNKLSEALAAALKDKDVQKGLKLQGDEVSYRNPAEFAAYVDEETLKWTAVAKKARLQLD